MTPTNPEEHEQKLAGLRLLIQESLESGLPVKMTREELRALIGCRMAELHGEVARGRRPAPGVADATAV